MTFDVVKPKDIPEQVRIEKKNIAIYLAARRLLSLGHGAAIRISLNGANAKHVCRKAHVFFRFRPQSLRTRTVGDYIYLWLKDETPAKFEVVSVPARKKEKVSAAG